MNLFSHVWAHVLLMWPLWYCRSLKSLTAALLLCQLRILPLVPIVLPVGKLYMSLFPNQEHSLIENSFTMIAFIQHAYTEVMAMSQVAAKAKNAIDKQKSKVLSDMLTFTSNTLSRLFIRDNESDLLQEMFMRELYYTSINIIRVFEFSILDLLKVRAPSTFPSHTAANIVD